VIKINNGKNIKNKVPVILCAEYLKDNSEITIKKNEVAKIKFLFLL
tara:strand:+ start:352 stop:489 length:138 start_codon:yes stop_codon:yes gene_type:complete